MATATTHSTLPRAFAVLKAGTSWLPAELQPYVLLYGDQGMTQEGANTCLVVPQRVNWGGQAKPTVKFFRPELPPPHRSH